MTTRVIPDDVIDALHAEAIAAHLKHGDRSLLGGGLDDGERLAALVEEVGEAAGAMTYDKTQDDLEAELVQVANVALSWVTWLRRNR